ncbi:MAG: response regulator transcription factor [Anaerolineae bacterium]|nr:response regulator transcription factor [Anaerolineae bacterium]
MPERIMVVDDDHLTLEHIRVLLETEGFETFLIDNGVSAQQAFQRVQPHLVILDIRMPGVSGWEVCQYLRQISNVPIVILTCLGDKEDVVRGLNAGADDYLVKPFRDAELLARVRAVLRRAQRAPFYNDMPMRFGGGDLIIDPTERRVIAYGKLVELTATEHRMLLFLARNAGRALPAHMIFSNVWSYESDTGEQSVKWYIWRLRRKIEQDPRRPRFILTERGIGYRFAPM